MKKIFGILLCLTVIFSAFAVPALADDADVIRKISITNPVNAKASIKDLAIDADGAITGNMKANKQEVNINFDAVDASLYYDNGYIGFNITMSQVPTTLRIYPYSRFTDEEGLHEIRPGSAIAVKPTDMTAGKPYWVWIPISSLATSGVCKTSGHTAGTNCHAEYTQTSIGKIIIQPDITSADAVYPVSITVKELAFYAYSTTINGVEKEGYWSPVLKGNVTSGNVLKNTAEYGYKQGINGSKDAAMIDTNNMASAYTMNDGYITFSPNETYNNGLAFYMGISKLITLPAPTYTDSKDKVFRDYSDYVLRLKVRSHTVPEKLYVGPCSGYNATKVTGVNAGGIRVASTSFADWTPDEWFILDIPVNDFMKSGIAKVSSNANGTIGSINLFFRNAENALSDIDIADIAIYGPKRGLTVTNLKITKGGAETEDYSAGDSLVLQAVVTNSASTARAFKAIGAFYNSGELSDVTVLDMSSEANSDSVTLSSEPIAAPEGTTKFKAFIFNGMDDITPLCKNASIPVSSVN